MPKNPEPKQPEPPRYPVECPNCGMVLHQNHAAVYGECLLCGFRIPEPKSKPS